jgi:hypothetical protein
LIVLTTAAILLSWTYYQYMFSWEHRFAVACDLPLGKSKVVAFREIAMGPLGTDGICAFEIELRPETVEAWLNSSPWVEGVTWAPVPAGFAVVTPDDWEMPPEEILKSPKTLVAQSPPTRDGESCQVVVSQQSMRAWFVKSW